MNETGTKPEGIIAPTKEFDLTQLMKKRVSFGVNRFSIYV